MAVEEKEEESTFDLFQEEDYQEDALLSAEDISEEELLSSLPETETLAEKDPIAAEPWPDEEDDPLPQLPDLQEQETIEALAQQQLVQQREDETTAEDDFYFESAPESSLPEPLRPDILDEEKENSVTTADDEDFFETPSSEALQEEDSEDTSPTKVTAAEEETLPPEDEEAWEWEYEEVPEKETENAAALEDENTDWEWEYEDLPEEEAENAASAEAADDEDWEWEYEEIPEEESLEAAVQEGGEEGQDWEWEYEEVPEEEAPAVSVLSNAAFKEEENAPKSKEEPKILPSESQGDASFDVEDSTAAVLKTTFDDDFADLALNDLYCRKLEDLPPSAGTKKASRPTEPILIDNEPEIMIREIGAETLKPEPYHANCAPKD